MSIKTYVWSETVISCHILNVLSYNVIALEWKAKNMSVDDKKSPDLDEILFSIKANNKIGIYEKSNFLSQEIMKILTFINLENEKFGS